jgi:hypothetical protein
MMHTISYASRVFSNKYVPISVLTGREAKDKAAICLGKTALDSGNLPRPRRVFANADLGSIVVYSNR